MQSFFAVGLLTAGSLISSAVAQNFNISSISLDTRTQWCQSQVDQCPFLCRDLGQTKDQNKCFPDNLYYICTCTNGVTPNVTEYSLTIPYYECTTIQQDCVMNCGSDNDCSNDCRVNNECGAKDPKKGNGTLASASSTLATATATATSSSSSATPTHSSAAGSIVYQTGSMFGTGLIAMGVAVGAVFVL